MTTEADHVPNFAAPGEHGFRAFIDWLNERLYPVIGPAELGPYERITTRIGVAVCPICGKPMSDHVIERPTTDPLLHCPSTGG